MSLNDLVGQPRALALLGRAAAQPSHAYLFVGPAGVGKRTAALSFAKAINCLTPGALGCGFCRECEAVESGNHPDVRVWDVPEDAKTFKIEQVRELQHAVAFHPYQARSKVHVLAALDTIGPAGANALLKTLEEPPAATVLVLIATSLDAVLPTLVSRCQVVTFGLMPTSAIAEALMLRRGLGADAAMAIAFRSQGRIGRAFELASAPSEPAPAPGLPGPGEALSWSDALASRAEADQKSALDDLLALLRDAAMVAAGATNQPLRYTERAYALAEAAPAPFWLERARQVEQARDRLDRHANARLVFDELARSLTVDANGRHSG